MYNFSFTIEKPFENDSVTLFDLHVCNNCSCTVWPFSIQAELGCRSYEVPNATTISINDGHTVNVGSNPVIKCTFEGDVDISHYRVVWTRDSHDIMEKSSKYIIERNDTIRDSCTFYSTLRIKNADTNDSGTYACQTRPYDGGMRGGQLSIKLGNYHSLFVSFQIGGWSCLHNDQM